MNPDKILKRICNAIISHVCHRNARLYVWYLRRKGIKIGTHFLIQNHSVKSVLIDVTRPSLVTIGNNVTVNKNFNLFTHDFVCGVFLNKYHDFVPSSGRVTIGNNVRFGVNCTVLKGVTIGDNCFIGAGSIVTKDIPSNSIAVGIPCHVIMPLDDYYKKRKIKCVEEALEYARSIKERFGRRPEIEDFYEEFPLFLKGTDEVSTLPIKEQLRDSYQYYREHNKPVFDGFEDFLNKAGI